MPCLPLRPCLSRLISSLTPHVAAVLLFSCALGMLLGAKPAHAQGTVTGVTVTTSVSTVTVPVNTPATFTATATAGTPNPDPYWTVVKGPTFSWWGYGAADPSTNTLSYTFSSAGTNTVTPTCVVSYIVQYARGGTATISETASAAKPVTIYVIGGPITGENDKSYFCSSNDTSGFGHLSAASGQPAGTTYSWSISGSAIFCDSNGNSTSPTGASAVYRGTNPGSTKPGDVTANVTYSLNGVSAKSDNFPITIHVPVSFAITAKTGPTKLLPPDPKNLCKNLGYVCIFRRAQRIALTSSQASLLLVVCS